MRVVAPPPCSTPRSARLPRPACRLAALARLRPPPAAPRGASRRRTRVALSAAAAPAPCEELSAASLLRETAAALRRSGASLAALSLSVFAAEQALGAAVFLLLALAGCSAESPLTLAAGAAGVAAGAALGLSARAAAFRTLASERAGAAGAWAAVRRAAAAPPPPLPVLAAEARRLLALAWALLPTFPLPLLLLPKACQLAFVQPALALESGGVGDAFRRSLELSRGRLRPLALAYAASLSAHLLLLAGWLTALLLICPSLPAALLPQPPPAAADLLPALAQHFASGAAFASVFESGSGAQRLALGLALAAGAAQRWAATAQLRALAFVAYARAAELGPRPVVVGLAGRVTERLRAAAAALAARGRAAAAERAAAAGAALRAWLPRRG